MEDDWSRQAAPRYGGPAPGAVAAGAELIDGGAGRHDGAHHVGAGAGHLGPRGQLQVARRPGGIVRLGLEFS